MNFKEYTIKSQEAIQQAVNIASGKGHQAIEPGHILKGIIEVEENIISFLFSKLNINNINHTLDAIIDSYPRVSGGEPYLSKTSNDILQKAKSYLKEFNDQYVSIEHLLLALLSVKDAVSNMLKDAGVTEKDLVAAIKELRKGATVDSQTAEDNFNALNRFAINLNEQARNGKLDPVIGRDEEIRRVLQILSRRTKKQSYFNRRTGSR